MAREDKMEDTGDAAVAVGFGVGPTGSVHASPGRLLGARSAVALGEKRTKPPLEALLDDLQEHQKEIHAVTLRCRSRLDQMYDALSGGAQASATPDEEKTGRLTTGLPRLQDAVEGAKALLADLRDFEERLHEVAALVS